MDKKAKNILLNTYWGSTGWISEPKTNVQDFAYAKSHGLMFDPVSFTHDECLEAILASSKRITSVKAAAAFISSLSTRRLDWRSSAASYHLACQMSHHHYTPAVSGMSYQLDGTVANTSYNCLVCRDLVPGLTMGYERDENVDLNVLNFERIKWGGVRHGQLIYIWFDLQELERAVIPAPTTEDVAILEAILSTVQSSQPNDRAGTLERRLAAVVKSSKNEE